MILNNILITHRSTITTAGVDMTRSNSKGAEDAPKSPHTSTPSSPITNQGNTDPPRLERRNSRLASVVGSIRHALADEQEKLFGSGHAKPTKAEMDAHLNHIRELDREQRARVEQELMWEADAKESTSPAFEARKSSGLNENGMGPNSPKERADAFGWPGLGSYQGGSAESGKMQRTTSASKHAPRIAELEPRFEAATFEAIDNAAESESYGWPGIGQYPDPQK